jgi:diguanylate cyclase (GGDEF)-like protein
VPKRLVSVLAFSREKDVILAQYAELKRQVPLLYSLLTLNAGAAAYTHWHFAPHWLTLGFLSLLVPACGLRAVGWMLAKDAGAVCVARARTQLKQTTFLAGALSAAFITWSLLLDQYGGPAERGHLALFIAVTVIGCIFCLVTLPQAAMLVTAIVTIPYLIYYFTLGDPVFAAMATNIALVTLVMVRVLLNSYERFTTLIQSRATLATQQKEAERLGAENARLAHTDPLTGLPNRRHFLSELDRQLARAKTDGTRLAVGVIDLDRFKPINDTYGHVVGDRLLMEIGHRLASLVSPDMLIARLGGDEFGVLLTRGADEAEELGQSICDFLSTPLFIDGNRLVIGCSAGFAIFPDAGATVHELFDRSDYALYYVKSGRRGGCALFSLEHETLIRSERAIEAALQAADLSAELHVRFQPIVSIETGNVLGVEALGRWTSRTLGAVSPDRFIPTAERLGLISSVTIQLFEKALDAFAHMPSAMGMSFNLSAHDIASSRTIDQLIAMVAGAAIDPKRITFEITETALMRDFDAAVAGIRSLRSLGIRIALDDFGTGYSSLGYLRRLPLDKVKVDRSFIADMHDASGRNIITAILGLCQTLGLDCIVEGVETEAQLDALAGFGYRLAQGYLFAEPMVIETLLGWLDRQAVGNVEQLRGVA